MFSIGSLLGMGILLLALWAGFQIVINGFLIWFIANFLMSLPGKTKLSMCFLCALMLLIVSVLALACMAIPIPIVNFTLAIFVWYKGSMAAIEGTLEIPGGSLTLFALYLIIGAVIRIVLSA